MNINQHIEKFKTGLQSFILLSALVSFSFTAKAQITFPFNFTYEGNPLVRIHGAADPDVHVWNDTIWMYCSQDHEVVNGDTYATMDGYHAFSSSDMINWTDHGEVLHSRDVSWGVDGFMWAPGAARKNGKYYLYYPHKDKSNNWRVGIAISEVPQGPFIDIGYPLEGISGIDPAIFIDDDDEAYIYNGSHVVAKLKPNMIELAESPRKVDYAPQEVLDDDLRRFHEGSYMHKKDGIYYFSYSNFKNQDYQGWYAIADNPYGPFEWKGPMAPNPRGAQDHHSIIEFKGQWYYFYHIAVSGIPVNKEGQGRIACYDRLYYNKDGSIQMVVHTYGPTKILTTDAPNGSIILDPPGGAYASGTEVTLTAIGDLGFAFDSWNGDLSGSENIATILMDADKSVSASFVTTPTYTLNTNSINGSVILDPPGGEYNSGTVVTLTPVDDFGYDFSTWSGDLSGTDTPATIIMDSDKNVTANFESVPTYALTIDSPNGSIEINPPGGNYEEGTTVSLKAVRDFGFEFAEWSGDISGTTNPISITMDSDKNITANFSYVEGSGDIVFATNCGGEAFKSSDGVNYSADMNSSGGITFNTSGAISGTLDDKLYQTDRFGNTFSYNIPLPIGYYQVSLMFAEVFFNDSGKRVFDVSIEGSQVISDLDIYAEAGKSSAYIETFNIALIDGELNISFSTDIDNAKISAIKILKPEGDPGYTLKTNAINGTIEIFPPEGLYSSGTEVSLTANPNPGYQFIEWSGDLSGTLNPATITMNSDKTVTAVFSLRDASSLVFATNCGGTAYSSNEGIDFTNDSLYTGGGTYATSAGILNTSDDVLYQSERYGNNFSYNIPLANDGYAVSLLFAEIYHTSANNRLFDVSIEGTKVIKSLDIWNEAGKDAVYSETHLVSLKDGELNILFNTIKDNAKISAIKIIKINAHTLTIDATNGSLNLNPPGGTYEEGTMVSLNAIPDAGYEFFEWRDDLSGAENPTSITMDEDKNVTAVFSPLTSLNDFSNSNPLLNRLEQNYPNPFSQKTTIPYQLNEASYVKLNIYNFLGQLVATLVNEYQSAGYYEIDWYAKDKSGRRLPQGLYPYRLETGDHSIQMKKSVLLGI